MRLLLVEDDVAIQEFLSRALTEAGYTVDAASNAKTAEALALEGIHDAFGPPLRTQKKKSVGRRGSTKYQLVMPDSNDKCFGGADRREFLQAGGCFIVAFAALGLPSSLSALPVAEMSGAGSGNEKRYPLPTSDSVNIDRKTQVILICFQSSVYAFALACPHEHAAVKWLSKDHRFQCSKHDLQYQPNGTYTAGRATRILDRFAIRREDGWIVVDLNHWFESDKNPSGWASAAVQL